MATEITKTTEIESRRYQSSLLLSGCSQSVDNLGANQNNLQPVEWVVGEWTTEYELPQDVPGFGTKGDMVHVSQLGEWNQNRDAIQTEAIVTVNGKTLGGSKGLTSWDAAKGQKVAKSGAAR